jgi:hypothetical protein
VSIVTVVIIVLFDSKGVNSDNDVWLMLIGDCDVYDSRDNKVRFDISSSSVPWIVDWPLTSNRSSAKETIKKISCYRIEVSFN